MATKSILAMLIVMGGLTALSIDIYLPAVAEIANALGSDGTKVSWTISIFMVSFAFGQLVYGPLSDRFGRKITFLAGMVIYLIANLGCAMALSIETLLIWRFIQGLGACAGTVSCFAIARDLFSGHQLTETLSKIATAIALAPILAPMLGAKLTVWWGWPASFMFLAVVAGLLAIWVGLALPETRTGPAIHSRRLLPVYLGLFKHKQFMRYAVINSMSFAGLFVFISGGAPLMVGVWGLSPEMFSYLFAANASMYMIGSFLASKFASRTTTAQMARWGSGLSLVGGILIFALSPLQSVAALLIPMFLVTLGVAWALPSSASGGLEPLGDRAGSAAALQGFLRFGIAGLVGALHSMTASASAFSMGVFITVCGVIAMCCCHSGFAPERWLRWAGKNDAQKANI